MLIKRSLKPTNFCLPVTLCKNGFCKKMNWFYDDETTLWKAYYQLKRLNLCYKPLYPIVYDDVLDVKE